MTNTPETLNILNPDFRMPEHCGGDRWSILHGDSLQIIRQFEPNSFDAIITDPPYASGGSSQTTKNRSTSEKYSSMSKDKALPDFDSDQMDQLSWMFWTAAWLQDARRIAKPGAPVCLFIDWRQLPAMTLALQWAGWTWRGVAVWDKVASRPQKGRFRQQSEYIVWGSNGKMPLERNVGCLPGVFRYPNPQNRIHVTEKPLQLSLNIFPLREGHQIAVPGLMKTDDSRKPCHLGHLEQRVVIVFRRTEIQIHHNTPQSLNISVLYIVRFSIANRFRERTPYVEILPLPDFTSYRCFSCKYRRYCPLCRRLLYASANVSAACRADRKFPR